MSTTLERDNLNACRQFQAFYDQALRKIGARAPQPIPGQGVNNYRAETLRKLKRTYLPPNHDLYKVDYRALVANDALETLKIFEPQLLSAVLTEAVNPLHVPKGELRPIEELDETGVLRSRKFIGQDCFVKQMGRPGRSARFWDERSQTWYPQRTA
jgi:hypothetical protein